MCKCQRENFGVESVKIQSRLGLGRWLVIKVSFLAGWWSKNSFQKCVSQLRLWEHCLLWDQPLRLNIVSGENMLIYILIESEECHLSPSVGEFELENGPPISSLQTAIFLPQEMRAWMNLSSNLAHHLGKSAVMSLVRKEGPICSFGRCGCWEFAWSLGPCSWVVWKVMVMEWVF